MGKQRKFRKLSLEVNSFQLPFLILPSSNIHDNYVNLRKDFV